MIGQLGVLLISSRTRSDALSEKNVDERHKGVYYCGGAKGPEISVELAFWCQRRSVFGANNAHEGDNGYDDAEETEPPHPGDVLELGQGCKESGNNGSNNDPHDGAGVGVGVGVECDGGCQKAGSGNADLEEPEADAEEFSACSAQNDASCICGRVHIAVSNGWNEKKKD